ncbi:MAG TPA: hypothetical protein VI997_04990 [Candidatus Thermoplasmatota archaeon]|nr:hypothetical protein [Candidatus Thermoplasmatota archaeon]
MRAIVPLLAAAFLLAAPALAAAPPSGGDRTLGDGGSTTSCSVPCGYVYPLIRLVVDGDKAPRPLATGETLEIPARMMFTFDAGNEGAGPEEPGKPIVVTFEYPKKPRWVEITADPDNLQVPISPQYLQPNATDPNNLKLMYVYETDVTFRIRLVDTPVLREGAEYAKLLVFAKSTESGLYKPAYGIKEIRVAPEGAIYEAAPTTVALEAPDTRLEPMGAPLGGGATMTLTPLLDELQLWAPAPFVLGLDPPQPAFVSVSLVDEDGTVLYASGDRFTTSGALAVNLTFPEVGLYHVLGFAYPMGPERPSWAPRSTSFPIRTVETAGAFRMPQEYQALYSEPVTYLRGDPTDPAAQFEKFVPLPVYDGASSGTIQVALRSTGFLRAEQGFGNMNVALLDPNGAVVAQGVVDTLNPVKSIAVSGFPGTGLYQIRVFGAGANALSAQGATLEMIVSVSYDGRPVIESSHDGRFGAATTVARFGRLNATLPAPIRAVPWTPTEVAAELALDGDELGAYRYIATVLAEDGTVASSHIVDAAEPLGGTFTFPAAGRYLVVFDVESMERQFQVSPIVLLAEAGDLAAAEIVYPATYRVEGETDVPQGTLRDAVVATFAIPLHEGVSSATLAEGATVRIRGADGADAGTDVSSLAPGTYFVDVLASGATGGRVGFGAEVTYPTPLRVANPDAPAVVQDGPRGIPAFGAFAAIALAGAVALLVSRRR